MQERGRRETETIIRIPLLQRSMFVLSTPPKATESSAARRNGLDGSTLLVYQLLAPSLIPSPAAAMWQGKHGGFREEFISSLPQLLPLLGQLLSNSAEVKRQWGMFVSSNVYSGGKTSLLLFCFAYGYRRDSNSIKDFQDLFWNLLHLKITRSNKRAIQVKHHIA